MTIKYEKKGRRFLLGFSTDWYSAEEPYSPERHEALKLQENFGAIRHLRIE